MRQPLYGGDTYESGKVQITDANLVLAAFEIGAEQREVLPLVGVDLCLMANSRNLLGQGAVKLGIDPIHFGILITVNMEVGLCHPPVGLNLYVASGIAKMGITELTVAVWPWLLTMLVFLVIVTYWEGLSLVLPRVLGMM